MFQGVWADLILALAGTGLLILGILGLAMGGNVPPVRVPQRFRPLAKFGFTVAILVGLTLVLDKGQPDLLEKVWREIAG